ncbi:N-acetylmuramoyl-L-alanine amidase family protein [Paenibacillus pini]|uniref:N-acetylmuramoyl-L-alanine amidase n=1 Tax=Paenibacillus pini JCM 16418 TaxID=1236976 RepID=W7Z458_9BACL|nr:N-acetylmuramoyl-L-alanine amidase family protein [Paenibacillus pini]GAF09134.1 N-acetylmuramoyl-L-alanine amidase [Paenibacillus pini JCM 16418]
MKRFSFMLLFLFVFILAFPSNGQAAAASTKINVDGNLLQMPAHANVENVSGNIMIPFRVVGESLGFDVAWEQKTRTVTIQKDSKVIKLVVNQKTAYVDGNKISLAIAPILRTDTVIVPVRFVSESMGMSVGWDNHSKTVFINTQNGDAGNGNGETGTTPNPGAGSGSNNGLAELSGLSFSENRLLLATSGNVKVNTFKMDGPNRIVIDLANTKFSDTFGKSSPLDGNLSGSIKVSGYPDVSNVRYSLYDNNPSTVRVVIDLNYAKNYKLYNESGMYIIDLNTSDSGTPSTPVGGGGKKIVVIDAGHGAKDPGTSGVTGKKEKAFNLAVALKVDKLLKQESGIDGVLTRSDDTFLELKDRVKIASDLKADLFISIHANSAGSSVATGTETYYQRESSKALAKVMHKYLVQATGLTDRGVRYGNFHVIRETKMPAVLLEVGYLSNKNDESALFSEALQNRVAQGIVKGIKEYLGL